ncbi:uncharacterized protein LOC143491193 [Brachyhypopomus gauderio]|uniref:uncharacterized protein LOC143491193 n=1 Tax=Brachyhypopomus gauderio TaxID=698409 RepID=UPI0040424F0C
MRLFAYCFLFIFITGNGLSEVNRECGRKIDVVRERSGSIRYSFPTTVPTNNATHKIVDNGVENPLDVTCAWTVDARVNQTVWIDVVHVDEHAQLRITFGDHTAVRRRASGARGLYSGTGRTTVEWSLRNVQAPSKLNLRWNTSEDSNDLAQISYTHSDSDPVSPSPDPPNGVTRTSDILGFASVSPRTHTRWGAGVQQGGVSGPNDKSRPPFPQENTHNEQERSGALIPNLTNTVTLALAGTQTHSLDSYSYTNAQTSPASVLSRAEQVSRHTLARRQDVATVRGAYLNTDGDNAAHQMTHTSELARTSGMRIATKIHSQMHNSSGNAPLSSTGPVASSHTDSSVHSGTDQEASDAVSSVQGVHTVTYRSGIKMTVSTDGRVFNVAANGGKNQPQTIFTVTPGNKASGVETDSPAILVTSLEEEPEDHKPFSFTSSPRSPNSQSQGGATEGTNSAMFPSTTTISSVHTSRRIDPTPIPELSSQGAVATGVWRDGANEELGESYTRKRQQDLPRTIGPRRSSTVARGAEINTTAPQTSRFSPTEHSGSGNHSNSFQSDVSLGPTTPRSFSLPDSSGTTSMAVTHSVARTPSNDPMMPTVASNVVTVSSVGSTAGEAVNTYRPLNGDTNQKQVTRCPVTTTPKPTPTRDPVTTTLKPTPTRHPITTPKHTPTQDPVTTTPKPTPTQDPVTTTPKPTTTWDPVTTTPKPTPTQHPVSTTPKPTPTQHPVSTTPKPTPAQHPVSTTPKPTPTRHSFPSRHTPAVQTHGPIEQPGTHTTTQQVNTDSSETGAHTPSTAATPRLRPFTVNHDKDWSHKGRVFIVEDQPAIIKVETFQVLLQVILERNSSSFIGLTEVEPFLHRVAGYQNQHLTWHSGAVIQTVVTFQTGEARFWLGRAESLLSQAGLSPLPREGLFVGGVRVKNITVGGLHSDVCSWLFECPLGFQCVSSVDNASCSSVCRSEYCRHHGICVHRPGEQPVCQCPVGEDFWFMGQRCDLRMTRQRLVGMCVGVLAVVAGLMALCSYLAVRRFKSVVIQAKVDQTRSSYRRFNHFDELSARFWGRSWPGSEDSLDNPTFTRSDELLHMRALDRTCCYHDDTLSIVSTYQGSTTHLSTVYPHSSQYHWNLSNYSLADCVIDSGKASDLSVCSWPIEPIQWTPFPLLQQLNRNTNSVKVSRPRSYCEGMELVDLEKSWTA